jgi:conjugative transfer signal peptidase TraF
VEVVMTGQLYSTAENAPGSLNWHLQNRRLKAAGRALGTLAAIAFVAAIVIAAGDAFGLLISNTDSAAPAGIYRVVSGAIKRGDLVAACLPVTVAQFGLTRGYLRTGSCPGDAEAVGKIIGGMPGDRVDIEPGRVAVNGRRFRDSATASQDSAGRPLHHVPFGRYIVAANQVWLFGFNDRRSWDSRYFGPVPLSNVRGRLQPVLTW